MFLGLSPKKTQQSMVDEIALHGLGAYLSDLGAEKSSSVCWIGDPQSVYLNKFIGTQDSIWDRWKEKARSKSWSRKLSCFDPGFKAIVAIFPLPEVVYSSMAREDSIALQAEASELLSQSGRAENLIKRNVLFHLQAGIQLMIYSRP